MPAPIQQTKSLSPFSFPLPPLPASLALLLLMLGDPAIMSSTSKTVPSRAHLSIDALTSQACEPLDIQRDAKNSLPHNRSSTPSTSLYISSPELPSSPILQKRVATRNDSPPPALALLASICSSSNIRWDNRKQLHYIDNQPVTPEEKPRSVAECFKTSAHMNGALSTGGEEHGPRQLEVKPGLSSIESLSEHQDVEIDGGERWNDDDAEHAPQHTVVIRGLTADFAPSSPTVFSRSSPFHGASCGYSSSSERSMTLPVSSPLFPSSKKIPSLNTGLCYQPTLPEESSIPETPQDSPIISTVHFETKTELIEPQLPPETVSDVTMDELTPEESHDRSPSLSPSMAPSRLRTFPPPLDLSPLSSLVSSPLTEPLDDDDVPMSAVSTHFTLDSSTLSSRSASPDLDLSDIDPLPPKRRSKGRRASTNAIHSPIQRSKKGVAHSTPRFDTAPPEPSPRKRKRHSSPSSPSLRPSQIQRTSLSPCPSSPKASTGSVSKAERRKPGRPPKAKTIKPSVTAVKPKRGRPKRITPAPTKTDGPSSSSAAEYINLPMTGFLVEELALSRASAVAAPELLRAVLKSQPHLRDERPEKEWIPVVRSILHSIRMFGRIERKGTGADDRPLEDQWFYIPENDEETGRAELLRGLMPKKRAVTKAPKQYYFEPVSKLSRWDPEED